jgi:hypothetical protein
MRWTTSLIAYAGNRAAGLGQAAQCVPLPAIKGVGTVMGCPVLFKKAAESVQAVAKHGDSDMIGPTGSSGSASHWSEAAL